MRSAAQRMGAWVEGDAVMWRAWAPDRKRLEVVVYGAGGEEPVNTIEMKGEAGGYFTAELRGAGAGTLYKLRIDGEGPFPDPLSRSQPLGVHGPSEVVTASFAWTDERWKGVAAKDLVVYEVHVGTATPEGTFDALIGKLKEFRSLGVTAIELMPLASFPGARNWGYDGVSLYAPAAVYGGPEGLRRFIDAAHAEGLGVLIDAVYNHLGPDGNYLPALSKHYFTSRHKTPWGDALNVDGENSKPVREYLLANAEMWVRDYHADGLRLDATHAIVDDSDPHVLREIAERARAAGEGRQVVVIAEDERNDARLVRAASGGGIGLDGVWADDFHHQVRRAFAGDSEGYYRDYTGSAEDIAETVRKGWFYSGQVSVHSGKARGTPPEGVEPVNLVHCIQNHDQVGNRPFGDRIFETVSPAGVRAMSALLLLSPYTPLIFMGQEWNAKTPFLYFTDHNEELGRAVTEGRRKEFKDFSAFQGREIPDPQAVETFERSKLNWSEREQPEGAAMLAWYRELLRLRATHPSLRARDRGAFTVRALGEGAVLLERSAGDRRLCVVVGIRGAVDHALEEGSAWRVLVSSEEERFGGTAKNAPVKLEGGRLQFEGPAAVILEADGT